MQTQIELSARAVGKKYRSTLKLYGTLKDESRVFMCSIDIRGYCGYFKEITNQHLYFKTIGSNSYEISLTRII
jgi:hypothetical protein